MMCMINRIPGSMSITVKVSFFDPGGPSQVRRKISRFEKPKQLSVRFEKDGGSKTINRCLSKKDGGPKTITTRLKESC